MYRYWAHVRTTNAGFFKAYIHANNWYEANQMFKSMYGSDVISEAVPCY
jgi:hypothetical protein